MKWSRFLYILLLLYTLSFATPHTTYAEDGFFKTLYCQARAWVGFDCVPPALNTSTTVVTTPPPTLISEVITQQPPITQTIIERIIQPQYISSEGITLNFLEQRLLALKQELALNTLPATPQYIVNDSNDRLSRQVDRIYESASKNNKQLSESFTTDLNTLNTTLSSDISSLSATISAGAFFNGGNSFGTSASLGTLDNQPFSILTNGVERVTVTESGNVGVGTSNPLSTLQVGSESEVASFIIRPALDFTFSAVKNSRLIRVTSYTDLNGDRGQYGFQRYRGTENSPLGVADNDYLGTLAFQGYDGSTLQQGAQIDSYVDGNVTAGNVPSRISFVTGSNSSNRQERLVIKSTGLIGIGTTTPSARLHTLSTTEQLRLGYNASNYWSSTIGATGGLTMQGVGTGGSLTLSPTAGQNINLNLSGTGDFAVNNNQLYVDTSTGNVGVGTSTPNARLSIITPGSTATENINFFHGRGNSGDVLRLALMPRGVAQSSTYVSIDAIGVGGPGAELGFTTTFGGIASEKMRLTNQGYIGIGTSTPQSLLHLYVNSIINTQLGRGTYAASTDAGITTAFVIEHHGSSPFLDFTKHGNPRFKIENSGSVGIGTTTPSARLSVKGSGTGTGLLAQFTDSADVTRLTVLDNGNVGIGTVNPLNKFHVAISQNSNLSAAGNFTFSDGIVLLSSDNPITVLKPMELRASTFNFTRAVTSGGVGIFAPSTGAIAPLDVYTNSSNHMTISFDNSVLDTSDGNMISGYYNASRNAAIKFSNYAVNSGAILFGTMNAGSFSNRMIVTNIGNVGIGTTTPTQKLSVVGSAQFTAVGSGASAFDLNLTSDGVLTTASSDERLKSNITHIDTQDTLDKLLLLKPSSFDWKANSTHDIGLIAQEVEDIFPDLVFTNPTDGFKGVNYSRFITLLIGGVQELSKKVVSIFDGTANIYGDTLKAKNQLCVDDICVTRDQFKQIIQNSNVQYSAPTPTPTPDAVDDIIPDTDTDASSTEDIVDDVVEPEPVVVEEPIIEPTPTEEPPVEEPVEETPAEEEPETPAPVEEVVVEEE